MRVDRVRQAAELVVGHVRRRRRGPRGRRPRSTARSSPSPRAAGSCGRRGTRRRARRRPSARPAAPSTTPARCRRTAACSPPRRARPRASRRRPAVSGLATNTVSPSRPRLRVARRAAPRGRGRRRSRRRAASSGVALRRRADAPEHLLRRCRRRRRRRPRRSTPAASCSRGRGCGGADVAGRRSRLAAAARGQLRDELVELGRDDLGARSCRSLRAASVDRGRCARPAVTDAR